MSERIPESIALAYNDLAQGGNSDKVYHASLHLAGEGWCVVIQYGRRGSALMSQTKVKDALYPDAKKIYDKVVREKMNKGYQVAGAPVAAQVAPSGAPVANIKPPELLEEVINGAHWAFVNDDAYWMQDKSDGVSRGIVKHDGEIFGINKRGLPVPLPAELVEDLKQIRLSRFQLDAELVGPRLICRDILVANLDVSGLPYYQRFALLQEAISAVVDTGAAMRQFKFVSLVTTWTGTEEKTEALSRQKAERREGVVFKLANAPYRAGRNGQHKKYKFIKTLSAIVGPPNTKGKESVELFLHDTSKLPNKIVRCGTVSLIGKPKVKEGDVVEVAYLYAMSSGLMIQARLLSVRDDVLPIDCTTEQLIYKREEPNAEEEENA